MKDLSSIKPPKALMLVNDSILHTASAIGDDNWTIAFEWCLDRDGSIHMTRSDRRKKAALKPFGDWLYSIWTLCEKVHGRTAHSNLIPSPLFWFEKVLFELYQADKFFLLQAWSVDGKGFTKKQDIAQQRRLNAICKNATEDENPADPNQQPCLWRLIQAAIEYSQENPAWDQKWFRGKKTVKNDKSFAACHKKFLDCQQTTRWAVPDFKRKDSFRFRNSTTSLHRQ